MDQSRKRKRELEIAANFQKVLNHLPLEFYNAFVNALFEYNMQENKKYSSLGTKCESSLFEGNQWRADLVLQLHPGLSKIIFEFKLLDENLKQVQKYADSSKEALIVSISKRVVERVESEERIVQLTWNDLFNGLLKIASAEIRQKLIPLYVNEKFSPGFPDWRLGEPALSFLEDFLFTIRDENLVSFKGERVMVVAGNMATRTTKNHNVYWFGGQWDKDFQYLVVVNGSTIQYIGNVTGRYFGLNSLDEIADKKHEQLIKHAFEEEKERDQFNRQPIVILKSIFEEKQNWKYKEKGAITQSHRYFKSLADVFNEFKSE